MAKKLKVIVPRKDIDKAIKRLRKKRYSYSEIRKIFEMEGYPIPSMGYISKILNK